VNTPPAVGDRRQASAALLPETFSVAAEYCFRNSTKHSSSSAVANGGGLFTLRTAPADGPSTTLKTILLFSETFSITLPFSINRAATGQGRLIVNFILSPPY
jgi:hypothetical protein